jgi:cell division protein FtsL
MVLCFNKENINTIHSTNDIEKSRFKKVALMEKYLLFITTRMISIPKILKMSMPFQLNNSTTNKQNGGIL